MGADKDKDFNALPIRSGEAQGKSTENRWLSALGPERVDSFATKIQIGPDGTTTMLRTKGGFPEFTTDSPEPEEDSWPAIVFAFPEHEFEGDGTIATTTPGTIIKASPKLLGKYLPRGAGLNKPMPATPTPASGRSKDTPVDVFQADGRGKWIGVVRRHNGAIVGPDKFTNYVWSGTKATASVDYVTEEYYFMRHVGSCRISGVRKDFFVEDRPFTLGATSFLRQKAYAITNAGGVATVTPLPDFPFVTDRAYFYSGCGFVAPDRPAILLAETPGDDTMLLKLFVLNGGGWDAYNVSACMPGHDGGSWNYDGANVIPISSTKILVGPKWSYPRVGDLWYKNGYGVLDTSTGVTTAIMSYDLTVSEPRALDLYQFEAQSWVESITAWPRVSPFNTHFPIGRSLRYTTNGGSTFSDFTTAWGTGLPYGIEFAAAVSAKPNGDFSGIGFVVPIGYSIDGNGMYLFSETIRTTDDMATFTAASPTVFELTREWGVGFFALGSVATPSPIDVVCPWRRDSAKVPPAYWYA